MPGGELDSSRDRGVVALCALALLTIALICSAVLAAPAGAAPRTLRVTLAGDPAPNGCKPRSCSLREAVRAANAHPGADTIVLRSGRRHTLALAGDDDDAALGDLDVTGPVTIRASARGRATIDANGIDRALDLRPDVTAATLRGLLVRDGVGDFGGGGIESSAERLTIVGCKVTRNRADGGGAGGISSEGRLTIRDSEVSHNMGGTTGGVAANGRTAISATRIVANEGGQTGGVELGNVAIVRNSVIGGNAVSDSPAGNPVGGVTSGNSLEVTGSRIVGNDGRFWTGGINNFGKLIMRKSLLARNMGGQPGLRLAFEGTARLVDSRVTDHDGATSGAILVGDGNRLTALRTTLARNSAPDGEGGAIAAGAGAVVIRQSTLSGNGARIGGAISLRESTARISNSTVAGNRALIGGGISLNNSSTAFLNAVTVARNRAEPEGMTLSRGGGVLLLSGEVTIRNSLVALNSSEGGTGPDCEGVFSSLGQNMLSDLSDCSGFTAGGDRVRANPRIGKLKDNGGRTKTIALKNGSPAINRAGSDAPNRDQRGRRRGRNPDVGAFERG